MKITRKFVESAWALAKCGNVMLQMSYVGFRLSQTERIAVFVGEKNTGTWRLSKVIILYIQHCHPQILMVSEDPDLG